MENNAEEENQNLEQQQGNEVDLPQDPRFRLLQKKWFESLDCLHIGCNDGTLTIQIAKEFHCWSIHGIDILPSQIMEANLNLSRNVDPIFVEHLDLDTSSESDGEMPMELDTSSDSENPEIIEELLENPEIIEELPENQDQNAGRILKNPSDIISFKIENVYRNEIRLMSNKYDMILCLSTTHWTELNLEGHHLVTMFLRLWYNLRPKGRLVLEPKSLKPYGSKFYDSEAERREMDLFQNVTHIRSGLTVNILAEEFLIQLLNVDVEPHYRKVDQINQHGECIVVFKK